MRIRCKKALPWHCWSSFNPKTAAAIYFREGRVCTHSSAEWRGLLHRNELDRWSFSQISASSCLQTCHKKISFANKLSSRVPAKKKQLMSWAWPHYSSDNVFPSNFWKKCRFSLTREEVFAAYRALLQKKTLSPQLLVVVLSRLVASPLLCFNISRSNLHKSQWRGTNLLQKLLKCRCYWKDENISQERRGAGYSCCNDTKYPTQPFSKLS